MKSFDYSTYLSPFTWRYGSEEMRKIWSEETKRRLWRKIWVALAKAEHEQGLVSKEELDDLIAHKDKVDIDKAHVIEKEAKHDLMAEVKTYADQAQIGGGKIHLGATSMDIEDNADSVRFKDSLVLVEEKLKTLIDTFAEKIGQHKDTYCMAYTHLQPAEPTVLGYRFALYAQDLLLDFRLLRFVQSELKGKGMKGAVGTSASYVNLVGEKAKNLEESVMAEIDMDVLDIASQVGSRKIEFFIASALSSIAQSVYKFCFDVRLMQSPGFGEWQEPFGQKQIGSSAMPFKRNPIKSEQLCSLGRLTFHLANVARDNSAHMLLERTLDDSANRRVFLPEMFLAVDEMLEGCSTVVKGLVINEKQIEKNLEKFGPFAATEVVLMEAAKKGADRQELHEVLRENSLKAYESEESLETLLAKDQRITKYLSQEEISASMDPKKHIGQAMQKCNEFLEKLRNELS